MQILKLHKGRERSLERRHPWVFSRAIKTDTSSLTDGDLVQVARHDGQVLATGHYQDGSIKVRILAFAERQIDLDYYLEKIGQAHAYRQSLTLPSPSTDCYRLIHGEGDGLPGLIIDIYHDTAVLQAHSIGMHRQIDLIANAVKSTLGDQILHVYDKSANALPTNYAAEVEDRYLLQTVGSGETVASENGIRFSIDLVHGQKTGFFLDQRVNRELLGHYAAGQTVLNCFCYSGGFSLYALAQGAAHVTSIDISDKAMTTLKANLELNAFAERHTSHTDNVMKYLTRSKEPTFDIVCVDPPAFAKSKHKRHNAIQAYKRLNAMALERVKAGGMLFTFSCSQVVDNQMFYDTIVAAAIEAGRTVRVMHRLSQGPDHPVNIFHPEGNYLKGLVLRVD